MNIRIASTRTAHTTFLILIGALALTGCKSGRFERRDPRRIFAQPEELNPPWALPNRVEVPQQQGTPVSLQVIIENHGQGLLDDDRNVAVFRRDPIADQTGQCDPSTTSGEGLPTYSARIGWGDLASLSGAETQPLSRMSFRFCDENLRKFLEGAVFVDVRVQLMRSDGETSFNPPEAEAGDEPPFRRCVPVQRPILSMIRCLKPPATAPVRTADLTPVDIRVKQDS